MTIDPEQHVDRFSQRVDEWRQWYNEWLLRSRSSEGVPGDHFFLPASNTVAKFLREAEEIITLQDQVNIMMLAKIDELEKRITEK